VTVMQSAVSVGFFKPEFNDFLYAQIIVEPEEETLSVLSALARLEIDPWLEASELSGLSDENGIQRLARRLARLPGGRWSQEYCNATATRLIKLLPRRAQFGPVVAANSFGHQATLSASVSPSVLFIVTAVMLVFIALSRL
jgi:hypothetical protein